MTTFFRALAVAAGVSMLTAGAMAQTVVLSPDATPETTAADPLTPPAVEGPAPLAPGAPVVAEKPAAPVKDVDPTIETVRQRLAIAAGPTARVQDDRAALAGFYAETASPIWTSASGYTPRAEAALAELAKAADFGLDPQAFAVARSDGAFASQAAQADAEIAVGLAVLKYAFHARGGRVDPAKISAMIDMRPRPFEPKSVLAAVAASDDVAATLRKFHPQHAGFERLRLALAAERAKPTGAVHEQRIVVNMERWRWMPDQLGGIYVMDNVPEQVTRVVKDGSVVLTEKVVVGKPATPTPLFSANMLFVIFHPSWGVPDGIKKNEVGPLLRRASSSSDWLFGENDRASKALARHQLRVSYNGREINPDSIDWSKADVRQYHFSQPPSASNVLGVVKFRFPNRHDVYMHDTPERHLFSNGTRAFSHGCMRVQNPIHLAEVLLGHDKGWSAEKVQGFVRGGSAEITLTNPIPVHVTYFTASASDTGVLQLHGDIYGMDQRVATALAGKEVHMAAAPVDAAAASPAQTKRAARRVARVGQTQASADYNPFAGLFGN